MTPTAAWDHVFRLFGCGDWDPDTYEDPWWKWRQKEATKLKARMTRLSITPEEICLCADYCKATGIDIRNTTWVVKYLYEAKAWGKRRDNERSRMDISDRINAAISVEMAYDVDSDWISRLTLVSGDAREEVLAQWTEWSRNRPTSSPSAGRLRDAGTA